MISELAIQSYNIKATYNSQGLLSNFWMYYAKSLLESNRFDESVEVFSRVDTSHFDIHLKNFSLMNYYKISSDIQKSVDPKMAMSLKRLLRI